MPDVFILLLFFFFFFCNQADFLYKVSHVYSPQHEKGIAWNDAMLQVAWPTTAPLLSARDQGAGSLADYLAGPHFVYGAHA